MIEFLRAVSSHLTFEEKSRQKRNRLVKRHTIKSINTTTPKRSNGMSHKDLEWNKVEKDMDLHRVFALMNNKNSRSDLQPPRSKQSDLMRGGSRMNSGTPQKSGLKNMMNAALMEFVEKIKEIKSKSKWWVLVILGGF